jgi:hypothetical protein
LTPLRPRLRVLLGGIPDLWNAIGIALCAFALLEAAYIGQRAVRAAVFGSDEEREAQVPGHPYAGEAWYREFLRTRAAMREKYDPWRSYWAYGTSSPYLTVNPDGRRATPQDAASADRARVVFLLGGSAVWGYTARDAQTVPALVARGLAAAGLRDVVVENLAQPGYTIGHELAALNYEVARGHVPALAVFYDGINDIRTAHLYGAPGHAFFEPRFARLYEVEASRGFFASFVTPGERSQLVGRLALALGLGNAWALQPRSDDVCPALGRYVAATARSAAGLGRAWGFDVLFVQQPHHASTRKPLTPFEAALLEPADEFAYTRECGTAIDAAMSGGAVPYQSHGALFDDVAATVFIDRFGHVTETANQRIADALVPEIARRLAVTTRE